ncbi:MAG TPA: O-methyltransferase [Actinomycetota bacterium]|nr:O-methyltransferase [Actinomycetota bacterium]
MPMQIVNQDVEKYMRGLLTRHDDPVLIEMEKLAADEGFPIVNRHVGVTLEILARAIGARRIFELGSGYGYSAYWFARAVGSDGEVHCTDGDAENARKAETFLSRAGLWNRIRFTVGDAVTGLAGVGGQFDIVYNDIDKHGYPDAWRAGCERVRVGGYYICDNVLWSGRVAEADVTDDVRPGWTEAIREHNRLVADDDRFISSILPIRDGVILALRVR